MFRETDFGFNPSGLHAYAGHFLDPACLKASASGGAATALAQGVLQRGGCVFGVKYTEDFRGATYCIAENESQLNAMKGSKYIEPAKSLLLDGQKISVYAAVEAKLRQGTEVLFIGVGCTVAALHSHLSARGVNTDALHTVELICHGTTSPKVAEDFIDDLERRYRARVVDFSVRYKKKGWIPFYIRAVLANGRVYEIPFYQSDYGYAFAAYSRPACYRCPFRGANHPADLCIGDYWGIDEWTPGPHPNGVSVLIVQTPRGEQLLRVLDPRTFHIRPADVIHILRHNPMYSHRKEWDAHSERFASVFHQKGLQEAVAAAKGRRALICYHLRQAGTALFTRIVQSKPGK